VTSTAGFVVIGDEILTGKIQDVNTHKLASVLFERGVKLTRVETIPDDLDDIAETVRRMSERHTYVFTSGGIGPTHDDMTYEGVARAFGRGVAYREDVLAKMAEHIRARGWGELNEDRKRMALMPEGCDLLITEGELWVPVCRVENVHILPGVPQLFAHLLDGIADNFSGTRQHRVLLYTQTWEGDIAAPLRRVDEENPGVQIGSYPKFGDEHAYKVMVTLEGADEAEVERVADELVAALPASRTEPRHSED
jgi:molybdenum cofactor synthesis domain-containing protein